MGNPHQHNRGLFHNPLFLPSCVRGPAGPSHSVWEGTTWAVRPQGLPHQLILRPLRPWRHTHSIPPAAATPPTLDRGEPALWGWWWLALWRGVWKEARGPQPRAWCLQEPVRLTQSTSVHGLPFPQWSAWSSPSQSSSPWVTGTSSSQPTPSAGESSMDSRTGLCHTAEKPLWQTPAQRPLGHSHQCGRSRESRQLDSGTWESAVYRGPERLQRKLLVSGRHPA